MEPNKLIAHFAQHNITVEYVPTILEASKLLHSYIQDGASVGIGGSKTLQDWGIIDQLRQRKIDFLDRFVPGLLLHELSNIFQRSLQADVYVSSVNAITENGELVCVDKNGNRVAALLYGPKKVIILVGKNKVVSNLNEAFHRIRTIAGPSNAKRLNLSTPCVSTGVCMNCDHPQRLCNLEVVIKGQADPSRMIVILVDEEGGF
jgi:hypothetical protein